MYYYINILYFYFLFCFILESNIYKFSRSQKLSDILYKTITIKLIQSSREKQKKFIAICLSFILSLSHHRTYGSRIRRFNLWMIYELYYIDLSDIEDLFFATDCLIKQYELLESYSSSNIYYHRNNIGLQL